MVERKVKAMSVQASPVEKKIVKRVEDRARLRPEEASIQPASAPISQARPRPRGCRSAPQMMIQAGQSLLHRQLAQAIGVVGAAAAAPAWRPRRSRAAP